MANTRFLYGDKKVEKVEKVEKVNKVFTINEAFQFN